MDLLVLKMWLLRVKNNMNCVMRKLSSEFPTRSDTNRAVQPQKMDGDLKFCIQEVEGLCYLCSKTKALISFEVADLCLCFRIYKMQL